MKSAPKIWAIVFLAITLFSLTSCTKDQKPKVEDPKPETVLVLGTTQEPDTLDPIFSETAGAQEIVRLLFRDLLVLADGEPSTKTSTSGELEVFWRLKEGLRWSDGAPLTSKDVVFGHQIETHPRLLAMFGSKADRILNMRILSDRDFVVTWRSPHREAMSPRIHPIVPAHAYPKPPDDPSPFFGMGRAPIASGPYRLRSWSPGRELVVERNPHWALERPKIDRIVWRFFQSEDAFEAELKSGGLHALGEASGLSIEKSAGLKERLAKTHAVEVVDSGVWLHLSPRLDDPLTGKLEVRRAISDAIDRRVLAKLAYEDLATPSYGCFPPYHAAGSKNEADKAQSASSEVAPKNRKKLKLQYASGSEAAERGAVYIQSRLAKIGLDVALEVLPLRVLFDNMRNNKHAPLVLFAWRLDPDWDASAILRSGAPRNYSRYKNEAVDRLLNEAERTVEKEKWRSLLLEVDEYCRKDLPTIPLVFRKSVSVRPLWLKNWRPTGTTSPITWNAEQWEIARE